MGDGAVDGGDEDYSPLVGTWVYRKGTSQYTITKSNDGCLLFDQPLNSGKHLNSTLEPKDEWFQGVLHFVDDDRELGMIRLRYLADSAGVLSNSKKADSENWGEDIVAQPLTHDQEPVLDERRVQKPNRKEYERKKSNGKDKKERTKEKTK